MALAPWCSAENWTFFHSDGAESPISEGAKLARVTGRMPCPSDLKKDLGWWLRNDYEQNLSEAPWFEPAKPNEQRERNWALRNPLQNARLFVWGCADKNYTVEVTEGHMNPMVIQRDDIGEKGYQKLRLFNFEDSSKDRTFTSYSGNKLLWYWGTQPTGFYGIKFVIHK